MKIIVSPAKKMNIDTDSVAVGGLPVLLDRTEQIKAWIQGKTYDELKCLWKCNDKIAEENFERFSHINLHKNLTPAAISYEGIAYQYMAPAVFDESQWTYVQEHLRILSGFYGILRPLDGVTPYRLEMQAKAEIGGYKNLYDFWGSSLYDALIEDEDEPLIIDLASSEYSKCIEKYLKPKDRYIHVVFGQLKDGKVIQKATMAKMARGEMVRFMSVVKAKDTEAMKDFSAFDFCFEPSLSNENKLVFVQDKIN